MSSNIGYTIQQQEKLSQEVKQQVMQAFSEHALQTVGYDGDIVTFNFIAQDAQQALGVITGKRFWGCLRISQLLVMPEARGKGIGKALMEKAFEHGRQHGCSWAAVETLNYQARGFYEKLGFEVEFERHGYDHGCVLYYLRKSL